MTRVVNESVVYRDDLPSVRFTITVFDGCLQLYCTNATVGQEKFVRSTVTFAVLYLCVSMCSFSCRVQVLLLLSRRASRASHCHTRPMFWAMTSG